MLVGGEAFEWRPWRGSGNKQKQEQMSLINEKGQWEVEESSWGVLGLVWPRPGKFFFFFFYFFFFSGRVVQGVLV